MVIEDLRARNGVIVNGVRVKKAELSHADVFNLADEQFVYMDRADAEEECVIKAFLVGEMPLEVFNDWREERGYWSLDPVPSEHDVVAKIVQENSRQERPFSEPECVMSLTVGTLADHFSCDSASLRDMLVRMKHVQVDSEGRITLSGNLSDIRPFADRRNL